jgi:hypothetical protein
MKLDVPLPLQRTTVQSLCWPVLSCRGTPSQHGLYRLGSQGTRSQATQGTIPPRRHNQSSAKKHPPHCGHHTLQVLKHIKQPDHHSTTTTQHHTQNNGVLRSAPDCLRLLANLAHRAHQLLELGAQRLEPTVRVHHHGVVPIVRRLRWVVVTSSVSEIRSKGTTRIEVNSYGIEQQNQVGRLHYGQVLRSQIGHMSDGTSTQHITITTVPSRVTSSNTQ